MTPQPLRSKIVADRTDWIRRMLAQLRALPAEDFETFRADARNVAAAESYLGARWRHCSISGDTCCRKASRDQ